MGTGFSLSSRARQSTEDKMFDKLYKSVLNGKPVETEVTGAQVNENRQIHLASTEGDSCEFGSNKYYALCGFGGILSCGITHTAVVPLDLVKCRIQVDPAKYKNIVQGFKLTVAEDGMRGLGKGWAPTFFGYSAQGLCKFGFYEVFKNVYAGMVGEENAFLWRTTLYLAASASAEFFADIALCPLESVKVRIQTKPGWSTTLREGFPRILNEEGINGFYKGLVPLWSRQIPYAMMKLPALSALWRPSTSLSCPNPALS